MAAFRSVASLVALLLCVAVASAEINNFILVHGPFQNGTAFAGTVQALLKNNTLSRAVNLPGNSPLATTAERAAITFDQYVAYMDQVMLAQQRRPILVCHSGSAELCQTVVGRHAPRLIGVVFLSAWLGYPGSSVSSLSSSSFQASVAAAASRPDNSLPIDSTYIASLLASDSAAQQAQFQAITFPQPLPLLTNVLSTQDSGRFNDSTYDFPHYVVIPSSDASGNYAAVASTAYGGLPYTQLSVAGGNEFFLFSPSTLSNLLLQIQNEILYPNSAPLAAVANLLLVCVCAFVALVIA